MPKDTLFVNSYNPFAEVTLKTRIRQLLHTHQGRDKLFKVVMYLIRLILWYRDIDANPHFMGHNKDAQFTVLEKNLMTIQNARRLFRVGRFVAEFVRIRVTLIKCSELMYTTARSNTMSFFLQSQMIGDISARLMMCIKSVCDDVAYLARKGFLHSTVEDRLMAFSIKFYLPVLLIDCYLNMTRLAQGLVDASATEDVPSPLNEREAGKSGATDKSGSGNSSVAHCTTSSSSDPPSGESTPAPATASPGSRKQSILTQSGFSLLSRYDVNDKLRKRQPTPQAQVKAPSRLPSRKQSSDQLNSSENLPDAARPSVSPRHSTAKPFGPEALSRLESSMIKDEKGASQNSLPHDEDPEGMQTRNESFVYDATTYSTNINGDPNTVITYRNAHNVENSTNLSSPNTEGDGAGTPTDDVELVDSYGALCWKDFEIHWMCITQFKILLDLFVAVSIVRGWGKNWNGSVATAGFVSGLLSVYRVWTYGR